jgi:peptidoglycan/xylan/chitin deacetylase (PgdA/CDA1 family)
MEAVIDHFQRGTRLPPNGVLLTFDDGYQDHFQFVFPILLQQGIQGSFFPPVRAITCHEILDVNKIHFILATTTDHTQLVQELFVEIANFRELYHLPDECSYREKILKTPDPLDIDDVVLIKRLLQTELPREVRVYIIDAFFQRYVGIAEQLFSSELYLSLDQVQCMIKHGMHVGVHGYNHFWLDSLTPTEQSREIDASLDFLDTIGMDRQNWTMCYPYGAYNDSLIEIIKSRNCQLALTSEAKIANLDEKSRFTLGRLDTNHLPKNAQVPLQTWSGCIMNLY